MPSRAASRKNKQVRLTGVGHLPGQPRESTNQECGQPVNALLIFLAAAGADAVRAFGFAICPVCHFARRFNLGIWIQFAGLAVSGAAETGPAAFGGRLWFGSSEAEWAGAGIVGFDGLGEITRRAGRLMARTGPGDFCGLFFRGAASFFDLADCKARFCRAAFFPARRNSFNADLNFFFAALRFFLARLAVFFAALRPSLARLAEAWAAAISFSARLSGS